MTEAEPTRAIKNGNEISRSIVIAVIGMVIGTCIIGALATSLRVWAKQAPMETYISENKTAIALLTQIAATNTGDIRDIAARLDSFREFQKRIIEQTNRRLERLENSSMQKQGPGGRGVRE